MIAFIYHSKSASQLINRILKTKKSHLVIMENK